VEKLSAVTVDLGDFWRWNRYAIAHVKGSTEAPGAHWPLPRAGAQSTFSQVRCVRKFIGFKA